MARYLVGIGGTSKDRHEVHDDLTSAECACLEMAERMAKEKGIDPDTVDLYENGSGETLERGACPMGDDGAYWPHIEEVWDGEQSD